MHPCGLHFILGKKGSGKSMIAVKLLIGVLIHTNRVIVTNLPVFPGELGDYIRSKYPWFDTTTIKDRIVFITEARILKRFWLCVGNNWWIPDVSKEDWNAGRRLDYRKAYRWLTTTDNVKHREPITDLSDTEIKSFLNCDPPEIDSILVSELPPVQFIIDEIQNIFAARSFLQTSPGALFFLSQQRHLGADFIAISQNIDLVDKEFRDLADDFLFLTNWGRKQKSFFRLPKVMTWSKYDMKPGPGIKPMLTGVMKVDVSGLGQCYDTSAGVGIEGGLNADTKEKTGGISWLWFILLAIIAGWLLLKIPGCTSRLTMRFLTGATSKSNIITSTKATNNPASTLSKTNTAHLDHTVLQFPTDRTNLAGITIYQGKATAWFKDGSRINSNDPTWHNIIGKDRVDGCNINGTNYYLP